MSGTKQPNSLHCFVCGLNNPYGLKLHFYQTRPGEVVARYTAPERYQGYPGVVHGGIVAAMLDEVAGRALMGPDPETSRFMYTAKLEVHYRRPVPVGQPLRVVGRVTETRGRTARAQTALYGPDEELLAEAHALLVDVPEEALSAADLDALGWKVYADT